MLSINVLTSVKSIFENTDFFINILIGKLITSLYSLYLYINFSLFLILDNISLDVRSLKLETEEIT